MQQKRTNEELNQKADHIIRLLEDCNLVEKYKVVKSLYKGLLDDLKEQGYAIVEEEE